MVRRLEARVFGNVQGVSFCVFTKRNARSLGLMGTVENLSDGSVEIIAEGDEAVLKEFLVRIKNSSCFSHIESLKETWGEAKGAYDGFHIV